MPTYGYVCEQGHEFEVEQRMTDSKLERCPRDAEGHDEGPDRIPCGAPCRRVIVPTNFVLLGPGWARDNYQK